MAGTVRGVDEANVLHALKAACREFVRNTAATRAKYGGKGPSPTQTVCASGNGNLATTAPGCSRNPALAKRYMPGTDMISTTSIELSGIMKCGWPFSISPRASFDSACSTE